MRVDEFRTVIAEIQDVLTAAGNQDLSDSLGELLKELESTGPATVDDMVVRLKRTVARMGVPPVARYSAALAAVGFDELAFKTVFAEISADKDMKKQDLQAILRGYTGRFDKKATLIQLKDDLKRAFCTRLYDRDAQAMANRATPL